MLNRIKKRHIVLLGLLSMLGILSLFYLRSDQSQDASFIRPYEEEKDFYPLVKLMNDNLFWIAESPTFSPEKALRTRAPSSEQERKGIASIDVIEAPDDRAGGFIAYYQKKKNHGVIWLLAVDKEYRGQGYGERLLTHALSTLKKNGATYATLATRIINNPALSLYKKVGFKEQYRLLDRGMIMLIKKDL